MSVKRFGSGPPPPGGLWPQLFGVANFAPAAAGSLQLLAGYVDELLAKRLKVLFAWWTDQSNVNNPDTPARALIFVSPNVYGEAASAKFLRARLVLTAGRYDAASKPAPRITLGLRSFTGAASVPVTYDVDNTHRDANIGPHNYWSVDVELRVDVANSGRGQTYELTVESQDLCQVISLSVYEVPRLALSSDYADIFAAGDGLYVGGRVYDGDLAELWAALQACCDRQGSVRFAWSPMDSTKGALVTAGSLTNLFDANTAWDAAAYGFWCWPENAGTLDSPDVGVVIWAIVAIDQADAGAGEFIGALAFVSEYVTIGQIDVQNYQDGNDPCVVAIALQTRWTGGSDQESGKVDVLGTYAAGGAGVRVLACGMYDKAPLDPRSVDGLVLWLAADQLALADGDPVSTWADRSGNGNDATGAGDARPTFHADEIAGLPVVRFDGVDDVLAIADSDSYKAEGLTVFLVARVTGSAADMIAVCYPHDVSHTSPYFRWALDFDTGSDVHLVVDADVEDATADFATSTLFRTWIYATRQRRLHRDGAEMHANAGGAPTITYPNAVGLRIGADVAAGEPFEGDIAEILIFDRSLDVEEYTFVDQYLSEKYGLQRSPT